MKLTFGQLRKSKVAVLGWGVNNRALVRWLLAGGVKNITVLDKKKSISPPVKKITGGSYLKKLADFDVVVRTPGISYFHPALAKARRTGRVIVTSQTELFFDYCPCPVIGVTGSKGKSTLSSMIFQILKKNRKQAFLAGNIGINPFDFIDKLTSASLVVYELSSFQMEGLARSPQIALVLPVVAEHLDYHLDAKRYLGAKLNIVSHQNASGVLIISDFPRAEEFIKIAKGQVIKISAPLPKLKMRLLGQHQQLLGAYALELAKHLSLDLAKTLSAIQNFAPLEHRLQIVARKRGVVFVDDSKATTPEAAIAALHALGKKKVIWLGGGKSKGADYAQLGAEVNRHAKAAICFGQDALLIHEHIFLKQNFLVSDLAKALSIAQKLAKRGDWILLSPGATSLDQFSSAQERGKLFQKLIKAGK